MNRMQARFMWGAVKHKQINAETLDWLASVAERMLEADKLPGAKRAGAMVKATDLTGPINEEHGPIRFLLRVFHETREPAPRAVVREFIAEHMGDVGRGHWRDLGPEDIDDRVKAAIETIEDAGWKAACRALYRGSA